MNAKITDIAFCVAGRALTNEALAVEHPEWDMESVVKRTGVETRYLAETGETALDLAEKACLKLFERHDRGEVDAVLFCTQTPDHVMPPNACILHGRLGLREDAIAFDFTLACSGFVYGLGIAQGYIRSGLARRILLVNADTYSRLINPGDRSTRTLFSDAASATLVDAGKESEGFLAASFATDGSKHGSFIVPAGGQRQPLSPDTQKVTIDKSGNVLSPENIQMKGMDILVFVNSKVPKQINALMLSSGLSVGEIDWFVFHQASKVALDSLVRLLKLPSDKVLRRLEDIGNTVSASIPITLQSYIDTGVVKRGDTILISGFGVGLSWASAIIRL